MALKMEHIVLSGFLILLSAPAASAEPSSSQFAYLPLAFHAEGEPIRTAACLEVRHLGPETQFGGYGTRLDALVDAMEQGDRERLLALSHPVLGRDPDRFASQATAFIQQFKALELADVRWAFEFAGFVVFVAEVVYGAKSALVPFVFAHQEDGTIGFLPYRSDDLRFRTFIWWLDMVRTTPSEAFAPFCRQDTVARATHRIPVPDGPFARPAYVLLSGTPIGTDAPQPAQSRGIRAKLAGIQRLLADGRLEALRQHMTAKGWRHLNRWYDDASEDERARYARTIAEQEPVVVFDAHPLSIIYTKTPTGAVGVLYFIRDDTGALVWANANHVSYIDEIFKTGPLYTAVSQDDWSRTFSLQ